MIYVRNTLGEEKSRSVELVEFLLTVNRSGGLDVLELNDALEVFGNENSRASQVVELKFFGGLTGEEIAEQLGVSLSTVNSDWRYAQAWLYQQLHAGD